MQPNDLKLTLERVMVPEQYISNPYEFELPPDQWEPWLMLQQCKATWRRKGTHKEPALRKRQNSKNYVEWSERWECDHAGKPRRSDKADISPSKRRNRQPSIKVGCTAQIYVAKPVESAVLRIKYFWQHTGHVAASFDDMRASRNPDEVRAWLDDRVRQGFDSKALKGLLRLSAEELQKITPDSETVPYSLRINAMDIYNAVRRKGDIDTRLAPHLEDSLGLWVDRLKSSDWMTIYERTKGEEDRNGFIFAMYSSWQRKLILQYGDVVCLDSTHNTCRGSNNEKIFLTTVLARDKVTGRGVPLAFLLTNTESHFPLEQFLKWLRETCDFSPQTVMIDCSDTEALGIRSAFADTVVHVLYCYWHLWRAWDKAIKEKVKFGKMRCKEDRAELMRDVRDALRGLLQSDTEADFNTGWDGMYESFGDQPNFMKYMETEWYPVRERWARPWRKHAHYGIDTNNFIESWHANLKKNYIGVSRRQRLDHIIRILSQDVESDYMRAHVRSELGFRARNLCKAEVKAKKLADALTFPDAQASVTELNDTQIRVESFTKDNLSYLVTITDKKITACNCASFTQSHLTCKHIFLALRTSNYTIDLSHTTVPARRSRESSDLDTVENQRAYKRRMISHLRDSISTLEKQDYWGHAIQEEILDTISKESVTRLCSMFDNFRHSSRDVMTARPDNATQ